MATSQSEQPRERWWQDGAVAHPRTLVLVAGSGRSGTSLFSGILQRLGFVVPQPEVAADATNPKGFAESQWVVDFHTKLLRRARVQTADARPAAWAITAQIGLEAEVEAELSSWLAKQFDHADDVIIKDPRLSWFLPLWRRCAEQVRAEPRFVTMLRHPAAVIDSKQRNYGGRVGEPGRAAGWVNQTLYTERATREGRRAFVRYEDLLDDWTVAVERVGRELDLAVVRDAPAAAIRSAHDFVDAGLKRSRSDWDALRVPAALRTQADEVWGIVSGFADGPEPEGARERLDALRAGYVEYYTEVEAVAQSSIAAARGKGGGKRPAPAAALSQRVVSRVPLRYKRRIPKDLRRRISRALGRS